jgi:hypothetical protein
LFLLRSRPRFDASHSSNNVSHFSIWYFRQLPTDKKERTIRIEAVMVLIVIITVVQNMSRMWCCVMQYVPPKCWYLVWHVRLRSRRYLVTARRAAEEEGITRKWLATKQCQGSVSYRVCSQAT